jgi:hypothetical protein
MFWLSEKSGDGQFAAGISRKDDEERKKIAKQFYLNFTDNFIEVIKLVSASPAFINKHFTGDYALCNKLFDEGKKCHFLLAHNFNWELGCLAVAQNIKQLFLVVYMPIGNKAFDKIFMKSVQKQELNCFLLRI